MQGTGFLRGGGLGGLPRIWGPENPISSHSRLGQQEGTLKQTDRMKTTHRMEDFKKFSLKKTKFPSNISAHQVGESHLEGD